MESDRLAARLERRRQRERVQNGIPVPKAWQRRAGRQWSRYSALLESATPLPAGGARDQKVLPHNGSWYFARERKFKETVIFVPFFGGKKLHLGRHIQFVNQLGFDVVAFEFSFDDRWLIKRPPFSFRARRFGMKHQWADEVEDVLHAVLGPKIIFAFSNPCSSAIEALVRRPQRFGRTQNIRDVRGMICDSGPFVHLLNCTWRLLTYERQTLLPVRVPATAITAALWAPDHEETLHEDLKQIPAKFPLLSIRGWRDKLVPVSAIDDAFAPHTQLQLEVLAMPEAGHLEGLKGFPNEYKPRVQRFLERVGTAFPNPEKAERSMGSEGTERG